MIQQMTAKRLEQLSATGFHGYEVIIIIGSMLCWGNTSQSLKN